MSKVDQDTLIEFGRAVLRANSLKGWTLDQLAAEMDGACGKSMLSKITTAKRDSISPRIVGKLITALELDEAWIDRFIGSPDINGEETKAEKDADRIVNRLDREGLSEGTEEPLLIHLANTYAEGDHRDLETAYISVKKALEAAKRLAARGDLPNTNTQSQLDAVLVEVAALNAKGLFDDADSLFDAEEQRMTRDHADEKDRRDQEIAALLAKRLDQDRVRNRPDLAADRLIKDLRREAQPGGLFIAVVDLCDKWRIDGERSGDLFSLYTALELAKANQKRAKGISEAHALHLLGESHFCIGARSQKTGT